MEMKSENDTFEAKLQESIANPKNMGEMKDADAIGTVGNADCGDMVRMFLKFDEDKGQKSSTKPHFKVLDVRLNCGCKYGNRNA